MATATRLRCPKCGAEMNHHANKVDYAAGHEDPDHVDPVFNGVLQEVHQCPNCGNIELRRAPHAWATPAAPGGRRQTTETDAAAPAAGAP